MEGVAGAEYVAVLAKPRDVRVVCPASDGKAVRRKAGVEFCGAEGAEQPAVGMGGAGTKPPGSRLRLDTDEIAGRRTRIRADSPLHGKWLGLTTAAEGTAREARMAPGIFRVTFTDAKIHAFPSRPAEFVSARQPFSPAGASRARTAASTGTARTIPAAAKFHGVTNEAGRT